MEFVYEDYTSLLEQANLQEKELRHKRRWLIGLEGHQFRIERPIPEYLLREDDVSYEIIKSFVEMGAGECNINNKYHILHNNMQLIHSPTHVTDLLSLIDNMTNQGLVQFTEVLTGGTVNFERTRWKMKQIIKKCLAEIFTKPNNTRIINLPENQSSIIKNPHNYRWSNESRFVLDFDSYHIAVHKILNVLEDLPTQTLSAMHRKLKSTKNYIPRLIPKKSGWGRDSLIERLRKKCLGFLSKINEGDSLQEPLTNAMEVACLHLKLIQGCQYVTNFKQFSSEVNALQNEIAMSIQLLDQKPKISMLKDIQFLMDPKAKLADRKLRVSIRNLLTEYLFECADMDTVPDCLLQVLAIIRKSSVARCNDFNQMKTEKDVECILNVSASIKQVLWDLIPENELDVEFSDAYMEDLEDSDDDHDGDDDIIKLQEYNISNSSNLDEEEVSTWDNFSAVEIPTECRPLNVLEVETSQRVCPTRYHLVSLKNTEHKDTDFLEDTNNKGGFPRLSHICKNWYLDVQAASDEASMVAYRLIGRMLDDFAQTEGCELNSSDISYLGVRSYDSKPKKRKAARKEASTRKEDSCSITVKTVEELVPSVAECEADRLKELRLEK